MCICVFCTGMKDHNCLKNSGLSVVRSNLRKGLEHTRPKPYSKWISISELSVLSRSFIVTARAQVGTGTCGSSWGPVPFMSALYSLCLLSPFGASSQPCSLSLSAAGPGVNALELLQVVPSPGAAPGTAVSDLKHFRLPRKCCRFI